MSTKTKEIAAIYARKSREDKSRDTVSIAEQIESGVKLAESMGYTVPKTCIYEDVDVSGKLPPKQWVETKRGKHRPALTRLIDDIATGKIDLLIVRKTDRLARSLELLLRIYRHLDTYDVGLQATSETLPTSLDGGSRFTLQVLGAAAELQLNQISDNIKRAKKYSKDHGLAMTSTSALLGYTKDKDGKTVIDKEQAQAVREMYREYLSGKSLVEVAKWYDKSYKHINRKNDKRTGKDGPATTYNVIKHRLRNPAYIGMAYDSNNNLIPSQVYKAIIDIPTWEQARKRIEQRKNTKAKGNLPVHLLSGLITNTLSDKKLSIALFYGKENGKKIKTDKKYYYNDRVAYNKTVLEEEWDIWAKYALAPYYISKKNSNDIDTVQLRIKKEQLEMTISDLDTALTSGDLPYDQYNKLTNASKLKLEQINTELAQGKASITESIEWDKATIDERRDYITDMIDKILISPDGVLVVPKQGVEMQVRDDITELVGGSMFFYPFIRKKTVNKKGNKVTRTALMLDTGYRGIREYKIDGREYGIAEGQLSVWGPDWEDDILCDDKYKSGLDDM